MTQIKQMDADQPSPGDLATIATPLRLPNRERSYPQAEAACGLGIFLAIAISTGQLRQGEQPWVGLFFAGIATLVFALGKLLRRFKTEHFAILHPDRIDVPEFRNSFQSIHWQNVTQLRWVSGNDVRLKIFSDDTASPFGFLMMNLKDLAAADRLTFIRYVRAAASRIPQERWPSFCRHVAVPLIDQLNNKLEPPEEPDTWQKSIYAIILKCLFTRPFVAYLLFPLTAVLIVPMLLSRKTWWTLAFLLTASAAINIRLFWGAWIQPFTATVLGTAAYCVASGIITPKQTHESNTSITTNSLAAISYLVVLLILVPLVLSIFAIGWIPKGWLLPIKWATLTLVVSPLMLLQHGSHRYEKQNREQLEQAAQSRWEEAMSNRWATDPV